jgi:hypothetical protein
MPSINLYPLYSGPGLSETVACIPHPLGDPLTLCGISAWGGYYREGHLKTPTCPRCLAIAIYCKKIKGI